jgi:SAM-dependent methyltransferase
MQADYGTYLPDWSTKGTFGLAAGLGGLSLLPLPNRLRLGLRLLALPLALLGSYMAYAARTMGDDDLKKTLRDALLAKLDWDGQGQALDIGTGSGLMAIGLARQFSQAQVVGCDIWSGFWGDKGVGFSRALCERNAVAEGVADRVRFEEGDVARLPYADGQFDAVVSNYVFHEVQGANKIDLLREALRVLRPGGAFIFHDPFRNQRIYADFEQLLAELGADELKSLSVADLLEVLSPPRLLRPILTGSVALYGLK